VTCADLQDVDEEEAAAQRRAERQRREEELDDLDEDEFADFLVDDEEGEKPGEPRRRRRALAKALPTGVSAEAFQAGHPMHMHACYRSGRPMYIHACTFACKHGVEKLFYVCMPYITSTSHHGATWRLCECLPGRRLLPCTCIFALSLQPWAHEH